MTDKRMLIVDSDLLEKIDKNRGEMSRSEMLHFLIDNLIKNDSTNPPIGQYLEREEFQKFTLEMKELLRRFLDFFMSYGMQLGDDSRGQSFEELTQKLQSLANNGFKIKSGR
jgi:hypothetical protein